MSIGIRFKEVRLKQGLKQDEFGAILSLNKGSASAIERETQNITAATVQMLIEKFRVSAHWLLTGEGEMYQTDDKLDIVRALSEYIESLDREIDKLSERMDQLEAENEQLESLNSQVSALRAEVEELKKKR